MSTVSVIIPTYNTSMEYLTQCILSVINQSFTDFELLILDDGSTQEYRDVLLMKWGRYDKRIRIELIPHSGVSGTRNHGVQKASGTYIAFLDADDVVSDYYLEESVNLAYKYDADFVIGHTISKTKIDDLIIESLNDRGTATLLLPTKKKELRPYLVGKSKYNPKNMSRIGRGPWARLIKRDIALTVSFPNDVKYGEDIIWNLLLLDKCQTVVVSESIWHIYRENDNSATKKVNPRIFEEILPQFQYLSHILDFGIDLEYKAYCDRMLSELERAYKSSLIQEPSKKILRKQYRKKFNTICKNSPWDELRSKKYFELADNKEIVKCLLLRMGIFCFYLDLRRRFKGLI